MITKSNALQSLRPGAEWVLRGDELEWHSPDITQPTEAEIQAEITRLQAEFESKAYQRSRAAEYPAIGDQLDALFHAGVFPAEMAAQIQAIKDKFPKG